MSKVKTSRTLN